MVSQQTSDGAVERLYTSQRVSHLVEFFGGVCRFCFHEVGNAVARVLLSCGNESEADKLGFDVVVVERAVDKFPVRVAVFRA